jgi:hypothetical protein
MLFVSWASIFFVFHAGLTAHVLILLSALFWLQGIILISRKKVSRESR